MNLLVSYNWIKEYLKCRESAEKFARKVSLCGPSVERSYPQAPLFRRMFVGQVEAIRPHPDPKVNKLRLVMTDLGDEGRLEFVCGGVNLEPGMKVAVALSGAMVRWHGEGEPVELQEAEIRGVKSAGMICGANEIGLAEAFPHAAMEILDLSWCKARPGTPLAKALGLEDTVFDIEVTTNRPDAFSVVGLAREAAAILGCPFAWKEPVLPSLARSTEPRPLAVKVSDSKLCTRYQAAVVDGICIGPSPWWLKNRLRLAGIRPINNIVDITNYVMLEYGQPLHAFDYDRLAGRKINVRRARAGEKMLLLDGRTAELKDSMLVIADADRPLAVAGVMGGEDSGVGETTKTVVFESATFDPVSVRRTARALNLQTESSLRFEKGLPEEQTASALARAVELAQEVACGRLASAAFDQRSVPARKVKFSFRPAKAEELIGIDIPKPKMVRILKSLGFQMSARKGRAEKSHYEVTVPFWRERDIEGERDFAEEIARIHGYHNLPSIIPAGELPVEPPDALTAAEEFSRQFLRGAGLIEFINYSLISRDLLIKAGFDPEKSLRLNNPLSVDFEYMRPCLIPGMLKAVAENQGLYPEGNLFEVSRVYLKKEGAHLPEEATRLLVLIYGEKDAEARLRRAKGILTAWCRRLRLPQPEMLRPSTDAAASSGAAYPRPESSQDGTTSHEAPYPGLSGMWHPGRSVRLTVYGSGSGHGKDSREIGWLGEIHPAVIQKFGLDCGAVAFELDLAAILDDGRMPLKYNPPAAFPSVRRDLAFVLDEATEYAAVAAAVRSASPLLQSVDLFDVYRGANLGPGKRSLALHLEFGREDRTLTAEEADGAVEAIKSALNEKFRAAVRS